VIGAYDFDTTAATNRERDETLARKLDLIRQAVEETNRQKGLDI
jgi:hypothetical protein